MFHRMTFYPINDVWPVVLEARILVRALSSAVFKQKDPGVLDDCQLAQEIPLRVTVTRYSCRGGNRDQVCALKSAQKEVFLKRFVIAGTQGTTADDMVNLHQGECLKVADTVAKVENCRVTEFSRNY